VAKNESKSQKKDLQLMNVPQHTES